MPKFNEFDKVSSQYGQSRGSDWWRIEFGDNKVRLLSADFEVLARHYNPSTNKSTVCFGKDKGCKIDTKVKDEKTGDFRSVHKPNVKYLVWLIDRKDNTIKIGELPYTVAKAIADLRETEEYKFEDVPGYDITIRRTKTGEKPTDVEYSVIPSRKDSPLTVEEQMEYQKKTPLSTIVEKMKNKEMVRAGGENKFIQTKNHNHLLRKTKSNQKIYRSR